MKTICHGINVGVLECMMRMYVCTYGVVNLCYEHWCL
jgi:hypothetical protein